MDIETVDDEILMPFSYSIDINECEDETLLRTMRAAGNTCQVLLYVNGGYVLAVKVSDILYGLLIRLINDLSEDIRDDLDDVIC